MQNDGIKDRKYQGVLYPDSESYCCDDVLNILKSTFPEFAYILHDKDTDENGELKKPHIHWVGKRDSPAPLSTIANALKIPANDIEFAKNYRSSLRYLVHMDNKDKYQYSPNAVTANFPYVDVLKDRVEAMKAKMIYDYIHNNPCTVDSLCSWCLENDLWSEFRRNFALWSNLLREVQYYD
mgnify:CR=1 FL=1